MDLYSSFADMLSVLFYASGNTETRIDINLFPDVNRRRRGYCHGCSYLFTGFFPVARFSELFCYGIIIPKQKADEWQQIQILLFACKFYSTHAARSVILWSCISLAASLYVYYLSGIFSGFDQKHRNKIKVPESYFPTLFHFK